MSRCHEASFTDTQLAFPSLALVISLLLLPPLHLPQSASLRAASVKARAVSQAEVLQQ